MTSGKEHVLQAQKFKISVIFKLPMSIPSLLGSKFSRDWIYLFQLSFAMHNLFCMKLQHIYIHSVLSIHTAFAVVVGNVAVLSVVAFLFAIAVHCVVIVALLLWLLPLLLSFFSLSLLLCLW
jgi:hypothetical protein